jgi:hypothetical protein
MLTQLSNTPDHLQFPQNYIFNGTLTANVEKFSKLSRGTDLIISKIKQSKTNPDFSTAVLQERMSLNETGQVSKLRSSKLRSEADLTSLSSSDWPFSCSSNGISGTLPVRINSIVSFNPWENLSKSSL